MTRCDASKSSDFGDMVINLNAARDTRGRQNLVVTFGAIVAGYGGLPALLQLFEEPVRVKRIVRQQRAEEDIFDQTPIASKAALPALTVLGSAMRKRWRTRLSLVRRVLRSPSSLC